eukprot:7027207-Alexandrium_andersonii.AAC.2
MPPYRRAGGCPAAFQVAGVGFCSGVRPGAARGPCQCPAEGPARDGSHAWDRGGPPRGRSRALQGGGWRPATCPGGELPFRHPGALDWRLRHTGGASRGSPGGGSSPQRGRSRRRRQPGGGPGSGCPHEEAPGAALLSKGGILQTSQCRWAVGDGTAVEGLPPRCRREATEGLSKVRRGAAEGPPRCHRGVAEGPKGCRGAAEGPLRVHRGAAPPPPGQNGGPQGECEPADATATRRSGPAPHPAFQLCRSPRGATAASAASTPTRSCARGPSSPRKRALHTSPTWPGSELTKARHHSARAWLSTCKCTSLRAWQGTAPPCPRSILGPLAHCSPTGRAEGPLRPLAIIQPYTG